jgi:fructokinase
VQNYTSNNGHEGVMKKPTGIYIFGEVLFDCFPDGKQILGGAPFNVAWHLQALGDHPQLISRVGKDQQGEKLLQEMTRWGLDCSAIQVDKKHPTGRVEVMISADEPHYDIVSGSAYDFIAADQLHKPISESILYHGSLCLRNQQSRTAFYKMTQKRDLKIFLDVNLRNPWWQRDDVFIWLKNAYWAKMNQQELGLLGFTGADLRQQMAELQRFCGLEQLIVTCGENGALIHTAAGDFYSLVPPKAECFVDTVGAGDAFSAVYLHGLQAGWPIKTSLFYAQKFASRVIGLQGATTSDMTFYQDFIASFGQENRGTLELNE